MASKVTVAGYHPVGTPTCLRKQDVGKLSQNADGLQKMEEADKGWLMIGVQIYQISYDYLAIIPELQLTLLGMIHLQNCQIV